MGRAKRTIVILSLALAGCRGEVAVPTETPQTIGVNVMATTATAPLLDDLIEGYEQPGMILAASSAVADWPTISARLQAGDVPFALTTYLPDEAALWAAPIGQDGIAVIVGADNPVPALTITDLRLIFRGQVTTWTQIGGADAPVIVISREEGADTRLAFESLAMDGHPVTPGARLALSSQSMIEIVANTPGAIGYVSMAWSASDRRARVVPIRLTADDPLPQLPTPETVSAGLYPLRAPILIVGPTPPAPGTIYYDWFAWMQSEAGQQVITRRYGGLE
jgi:phosphate transport system substrate-binding protein